MPTFWSLCRQKLRLGKTRHFSQGKRTKHRHPVTKKLLAAACGGLLAPAAAHAVTEPPDFGNTFETRTSLPGGTLQIGGSVAIPGDPSDFARFAGLMPGPLTVFWKVQGNQNTNFPVVDILNDSNVMLGRATSTLVPNEMENGTIPVTVPANGVLVARLWFGEIASSYSYTLAVPEPSSAAALAGLGALALLGRRRKPDAHQTPAVG
jgi:hypothetical protein